MRRPPPTRRERVRVQTIGQIKEAALDQLRNVGAAQLSLRAVAGAMGMSPAGLYRYYASRDDLLTALIADGFDALAAAVAVGRVGHEDADVAERLLVGFAAFRRWAIEHRHEFGLLYGDPIPGYAAPEGGSTHAASHRVGEAVLAPVVDAWRAGRLRIPSRPAGTDDPATRRWAAALDPELPTEAAAVVMGGWTRLHGLVILEVFGHLRWLGPDSGPLAAAQLRALVAELVAPA
ncbi:TetR/AcrR family transcriptional regulator [Pseudonocardia humida]|uniref:TetR/AcrR family transcriptional regulator n=1 Tax=Pseudonocardia humida TaxID=2800819 RepID=A0ABT1A9T0_9PSEU|nr:TetR/AcrR family transcriptional regulator [Pseudonocardia humida]MCO1659792.1 TetR/AcrR family transcriptional regulator [Pseudonocardia humida]